MKYLWPLVLVVGCIEYTPTSTMPPGGAVNVRPVETPTQTDRLVQVLPPEVDVLWIIDNSSSMSDEQAALTTNFPAFMDFFLGSGLLYHIGVVSTDYATDQGRLEQAAGHFRASFCGRVMMRLPVALAPRVCLRLWARTPL